MANKGALVIRFIGDVRDISKSTVKVSRQLEGMAPVAAAAGVAAGAALVAGVAGAINTQKANSKLSAQLGKTGKESKRIGKVAGDLYAGAYGDSMESVNTAVAAVSTSIKGMGNASSTTLKRETARAMNFADTFTVDVTRAAEVAGVAINSGLAKNSKQAFDLMTTASQRVPAALQEPVLDAVEEYSQFFNTLGMKGPQAFGLLVKGAEKGQYGIDKVGDAVKEFTIRATDGSSATNKAFDDIGLSSGKMANKFLKGGRTSNKAFKQTIDGLLGMKDPAKQAQAAIALFGTPLEDLNVKDIPKFLQSLKGGEEAMKGFSGSSTRMGKTLNDNAATNLTSFARQAQQTFVNLLGGTVLPIVSEIASVLATGFAPAVKSVTAWMGRNKEILIPVVAALGTMVGIVTTIITVTKLWAIAQGALNVVMSLNPIGLVVIAIAGLVAGLVVAYKKSETFRRIVDGAWKGVKAAISGVVSWWTKTAWPGLKRGASAVGNAFRSLGKWTRSVWDSISGAIGRAWRWVNRNVFRPFKLGLRILGFAFRAAGALIGRTWRAAVGRVMDGWRWVNRNVFRPFKLGLRILGLAFRTAGAMIGRLWKRAASIIGGVWSRNIRPVFTRLKNFVTRDIPNGFRNGVAKVKRFWAGIQKVAKAPVRFVVNTIWNNGLRKMINAIPGVGDIAPTKLAFRAGGAVRGPGTGTSDSITARLSRDEHVWTAAEVRALGGHQRMKELRRAVLRGDVYGGDPKFAKGGGLDSNAIARAQAFARRQAGKPYGWGAVGPSSYDCSGFMSALTNVLRGRSPHVRVGSTASFPWAGFERGPGQFTIGSSSNFSGGIGHMAGNLAGMGVESRGGTGVILGAGAMPPSRFPSVYHLGSGGNFGSGGGGFDIAAIVKGIMGTVRKLPGQIRELMSKGSWMGGLLKQMASSLWKNIATWINKKIPDLGPFKTNPVPTKFASGGFVKRRPGGVHAIIGEGRYDEVVAQIRPGGGGGGGGTIVIPVYIGGKQVETFVVDTVRKTVKTKGGGNVQKALGRGVG